MSAVSPEHQSPWGPMDAHPCAPRAAAQLDEFACAPPAAANVHRQQLEPVHTAVAAGVHAPLAGIPREDSEPGGWGQQDVWAQAWVGRWGQQRQTKGAGRLHSQCSGKARQSKGKARQWLVWDLFSCKQLRDTPGSWMGSFRSQDGFCVAHGHYVNPWGSAQP
jgi:hypothetical protein